MCYNDWEREMIPAIVAHFTRHPEQIAKLDYPKLGKSANYS
jgi:hypothetical protein